MTGADRVRAWRDRKRGRPPRVYVKSPSYLSPVIHQATRAKEKKIHKRAIAIRAAWDDPLRRALMSAKKTNATPVQV